MNDDSSKRMLAHNNADLAMNAMTLKILELEAKIDLLTNAQAHATKTSLAVNVAFNIAMEQVRSLIQNLASQVTETNAQAIFEKTMAQVSAERPWMETIFLPQFGVAPNHPGPYMAWSTCSITDFLTEEYAAFCSDIKRPRSYHRKNWEWAFIVHHLRRLNMPVEGRRGLVFGVGTEPLPSLFAASGATIVATDAKHDHAVNAGWTTSSEFASSLEDIWMPEIIDAERFAARVSYATCDMNDIDPGLEGFDFCWSSCCFEHLGSLQAGMDFVVNSVEKTLKVGGVACHTTEFNLSSDADTVETGPTVIYRKQDIQRLTECLRDRGHIVDVFNVAPDNHPLDFFIDAPPYWRGPHLRLKLLGYTITSLGLVVRRGR